eukprot:CAMPEP_0117519924 /NCGR_PEP_ID=MMETSP0784-20121206/32906_1 /TAXON_ID=39447 /ORGANISM="" /LENGTH=358 /DNA_ID=CAMNT_0005315907 /DNA_START=74 /DNA_END=1150 /DNA_ORIENTATION=-
MADDGPDREVLERALAGCEAPELVEMARRLARSSADLEATLQDLEAERAMLQQERDETRGTIELFFQEMQKLNIGSDNTPEPVLLEGPLDFVSRYWEKVKPRENAYRASRHVGELSSISTQASTAADMSSRLLQAANGFLHAAQAEFSLKPRASDKARRGSKDPARARARRERRERLAATPAAAAPAEDSGSAIPNGGSSEAPTEGSSSVFAASASSEPGTQGEAEASSTPAPALPGPSASGGDAIGGTAADQVPAAPPDSASDAGAAGSASSKPPLTRTETDSPVLIDAQVTLKDGTVRGLVVRAAERSKQVAQRFVEEHSLDASCAAQLTAWLKQIERDAVEYPISVTADLKDICA